MTGWEKNIGKRFIENKEYVNRKRTNNLVTKRTEYGLAHRGNEKKKVDKQENQHKVAIIQKMEIKTMNFSPHQTGKSHSTDDIQCR